MTDSVDSLMQSEMLVVNKDIVEMPLKATLYNSRVCIVDLPSGLTIDALSEFKTDAIIKLTSAFYIDDVLRQILEARSNVLTS
jgi:hypothetical protein